MEGQTDGRAQSNLPLHFFQSWGHNNVTVWLRQCHGFENDSEGTETILKLPDIVYPCNLIEAILKWTLLPRPISGQLDKYFVEDIKCSAIMHSNCV